MYARKQAKPMVARKLGKSVDEYIGSGSDSIEFQHIFVIIRDKDELCANDLNNN